MNKYRVVIESRGSWTVNASSIAVAISRVLKHAKVKPTTSNVSIHCTFLEKLPKSKE